TSCFLYSTTNLPIFKHFMYIFAVNLKINDLLITVLYHSVQAFSYILVNMLKRLTAFYAVLSYLLTNFSL
ncbi:hypothetical protein, partial [Thomasclavelia cocleata]|uniref:hypothetical protein n=1 Tax=Thomasclavelia cocleata TaxID=69824 RepID=UPI003EC024BA